MKIESLKLQAARISNKYALGISAVALFALVIALGANWLMAFLAFIPAIGFSVVIFGMVLGNVNTPSWVIATVFAIIYGASSFSDPATFRSSQSDGDTYQYDCDPAPRAPC